MLPENGTIPRMPIYNAEFLMNPELQSANDMVREALVSTFTDYHLSTLSSEGRELQTACTYQINEPGFTSDGKATADELQAKLDHIVLAAEQQGVTLGLDNETALRELMFQNGLGIDCSNFAFRAMSQAHERLGLAPYASQVYRKSDDVVNLVLGGRWSAKGDKGDTNRDLTLDEQFFLLSGAVVPVSWISDVFGKDPVRISGAAHICSDEATRRLSTLEVVPGDLVSFRRPYTGQVTHVASISNVERSDNKHGVTLEIMHSWHTRDFDAGLRQDRIRLSAMGLPLSSSRIDLINPDRYAISFR